MTTAAHIGTLTAARASELLGSRERRTVAHATVLHRFMANGGLQYAIRYHDTDVVTLHPDETYTLRTGGWWSATTKARINDYAPVRLSARDGLWWLTPWGFDEESEFIFTEGVRVDPEGWPTVQVDAAPILKAKRALDRDVSKYISGYIASALAAGEVESPNPGDCFGCQFRDSSGGDGMGLGHYRDHFAESYYVPSLLWNAIKERGYADPSLIWAMMQSDLARGRESHFIRTALTRFFRRRKPALLGLLGTPTVPAPVKGWQG